MKEPSATPSWFCFPPIDRFPNTPKTARDLSYALEEQDVQVDVRPPQGMPDSLADLQNYEMLILSNVPATALAPLREALAHTGAEGLEVDLLLASQPLVTYKGRLKRDGLGGETTVKDNAAVLPVRVELTDPALAELLTSLPVGLDVRARVHCGSRSIGYVWFGGLLEFVYERLLF